MRVYLHSILCLDDIVEGFSAESKRRIHPFSVACSSIILVLSVGFVTDSCSRQHRRHLTQEAGAGGVTGGRQWGVVGGGLERRAGDDQRRPRLPLAVAEIRHGGVLEQSREDHHKTRHQVDVDTLQVGNLQTNM